VNWDAFVFGLICRLTFFLSRLAENRNAGIDVMTNINERATAQVFSTSEHGTARVFGLSLTVIFLGLLILNGISF
jgi:hypothetical protein